MLSRGTSSPEPPDTGARGGPSAPLRARGSLAPLARIPSFVRLSTSAPRRLRRGRWPIIWKPVVAANAARAPFEPVNTERPVPTKVFLVNVVSAAGSIDQRFLAAGSAVPLELDMGDDRGGAFSNRDGRSRIVVDLAARDPDASIPVRHRSRRASHPRSRRPRSGSSAFVAVMPMPSGVAASPTMRNPATDAPFTLSATIAAARSDAVPGSRSVAPAPRR